MWNKVKTIIITVLAVLGVLFIILMIIPDDEDEAAGSGTSEVQEVQGSRNVSEADQPVVTQEKPETFNNPDEPAGQETLQEDTQEGPAEDQNAGTVSVVIPASEISDKKLEFTTQTLDGKKVDQDIFSDYDITLVHVWGTFCGPCIAEMGKYALFYENAPENVNLVGIVCDVYDGSDNNVDDANDILSDAGAGFMNLRTSDSIYDVTKGIEFIPSSFFVDREGHIIGDIMIGRGYDDTILRLKGYIK